ncbi:MAG: SpoIIE family protein phosphatase [Spirochaetes bacterium]|nr:SpoIIE family protein phosphatase [Spirochaetota bacterium]
MTKLAPPILCFIIMALQAPAFALKPLGIDGPLSGISMGRHIEYYEDRTKNFTIGDLTAPGNRIQWTASDRTAQGFGYSRSAYWIRFTVRNGAGHDITWLLQQRYPLIHHLSLYMPAGPARQGYRETRTGTLAAFAVRPLRHRTFVFPITTPANSVETYYMRYESEGAVNVTLHAFSRDEFQRKCENESIFIWILVGIFLIMIVYNFILLISFRDMGYLYYALYIASFLALFMSLEGIAYQYLWPDAIWWGTYNRPIFVGMTLGSLGLFMRRFADTKNSFLYIDRVFKAFIATAALAAAVSPLIGFRLSMSGMALLTALYAAFSLGAGIYLSIRGSRQGQFILASFCLLMVGAFLYALKSFGFLPDTPVTNYSVEFGAVIQITILSLGLADRINSMRKEMEGLTRTMDDKVNERTEELLSLNDEMAAMNQALINARDEIWGEMELAKKIQTVLLPVNPVVRGYEISTYMKPAQEVGGDYFDIINIRESDWIVIGDVSGHGVPAGLIMMMVQTAIHSVLELRPDASPSELLVHLNNVISENIRKVGGDKYMTITVMACIRDGRFFYSGLHQDIMIYRLQSRSVEICETDGMWLGIYSNIQGMVSDSTLTLGVGDTLLLFTDGITEAMKADSPAGPSPSESNMFGQDRLREIFLRLGDRATGEIKAGILKELSSYTTYDDVTMMILKRRE